MGRFKYSVGGGNLAWQSSGNNQFLIFYFKQVGNCFKTTDTSIVGLGAHLNMQLFHSISNNIAELRQELPLGKEFPLGLSVSESHGGTPPRSLSRENPPDGQAADSFQLHYLQDPLQHRAEDTLSLSCAGRCLGMVGVLGLGYCSATWTSSSGYLLWNTMLGWLRPQS